MGHKCRRDLKVAVEKMLIDLIKACPKCILTCQEDTLCLDSSRKSTSGLASRLHSYTQADPLKASCRGGLSKQLRLFIVLQKALEGKFRGRARRPNSRQGLDQGRDRVEAAPKICAWVPSIRGGFISDLQRTLLRWPWLNHRARGQPA